MLNNTKMWIGALSIKQKIDLIHIISSRTNIKQILGRGGMGHSCAYVIEDGNFYDYMEIEHYDFQQFPQKEVDPIYLLRADSTFPLDTKLLYTPENFSDMDLPFTTISACNHEFREIIGLFGSLGYNCKKCDKKREDL